MREHDDGQADLGSLDLGDPGQPGAGGGDGAHVDDVTGEILPVSAQAIQLAREARSQQLWTPKGFGGDFLALNEAVLATQRKVQPWVQNDKPGAHKQKYATLKAILTKIRGVAAEHGLSITHGADSLHRIDQGGGAKGYTLPVYCLLVHAPSGAWRQITVDVPVVVFTPQAVGSAFTFGKRYTTLAAFGLATDDEEDDDAALAQPRSLEDGDDIPEHVAAIFREIDACETIAKLAKYIEANRAGFDMLAEEDFERVKQRKIDRQKALHEAGEPEPKAKRGKP